VRTLRHYDQLGLLVPSSYTSGGHRCYTADDVRRLHRILALRGFGLSLSEIAVALDAAAQEPRDLLRRQLVVAEVRLRQAEELRFRLLDVLDALDALDQPSAPEMIELIEVMTQMERPLTAEEVEQMTRRRAEWAATLSDEEKAEMQARRAEFMASLDPEELARMRRHRARLLNSLSDGSA
jgi:DNA-binding transcriptional MerR regulator